MSQVIKSLQFIARLTDNGSRGLSQEEVNRLAPEHFYLSVLAKDGYVEKTHTAGKLVLWTITSKGLKRAGENTPTRSKVRDVKLKDYTPQVNKKPTLPKITAMMTTMNSSGKVAEGHKTESIIKAELTTEELFEALAERVKTDRFKQLNERVIAWANNKGIMANGTPLAQSNKTIEEAVEIQSAILKGDEDGIIDGIGDALITLLIQAEMWSFDPLECIEKALKEIEGRQGQIIGGIFVKAG